MRVASLALALLCPLRQPAHAQQVQPIVIPIIKERVPYYNISENGSRISCGIRLYGSFPVYKGRTNVADYLKLTPGVQNPGSWYLDPKDNRFRFYAYFNGTDSPASRNPDCNHTIGGNLPEWHAEYQPKAPAANFTHSFSTSTPGEVHFTATSTDPEGDLLTHAWTFGDGETASADSVVHRYTKPGSLTVTLTARDTDTLTNRISRTVTIPAPPLSVSLEILSKNSGNRIEPGEEFRVRATVSAGTNGVGDLTGVKFDGPPLFVPDLFDIVSAPPGVSVLGVSVLGVSAPGSTPVGSLKPGGRVPFEWVLRAKKSLGDFIKRTSTVSGIDAANRIIRGSAATANGSVLALMVGLSQIPNRVVLGEDNNGDGVINAEDERVRIVMGITNVTGVNVTEVRTDNLTEPVKFTTRLVNVPVALEPVDVRAGDFGTIQPGAANAMVRTNVYLATNYVLASASLLVRGKADGTSAQGEADTLVKVQNPSVKITMHALEKSGLEPDSIATSINAPLVPVTVVGSLDGQPQVTGGLVADGVTPLLFIIEADTNALAVANQELKVRLVAQRKSGFLRGDKGEFGNQDKIQKKLRILKDGTWIASDQVTMTQTEPKAYVYLQPIESDDIDTPAASENFVGGVFGAGLSIQTIDSGREIEQLDFHIRKPPIALVHGVNSDGSSWTKEFQDILRASRPNDKKSGFEFVKIVRYGQRTESQQTLPDQSSERMINITWPLASLAPMLEAALTKEMAPLKDFWAFTRYDVVGHSQGGVLLRMLCSKNPNAYVGQPFRNEGNFFRGRFHRVVTIGAPHNGTRIVPYLHALASLSEDPNAGGQVGVAKRLIAAGASAKFDPWGTQIFFINIPYGFAPWFPDPSARFHLIRTTVGGGQAPGSSETASWADRALGLNISPSAFDQRPADAQPSADNSWQRNVAINMGNNYDEKQDRRLFGETHDPDPRILSPGQIVFPRGSDGVVDFDSQGATSADASPPSNVFTVDKQHKISHSATPILGGEDGGQLESPEVAKHVIGALDQTGNFWEETFSAFRLPQRLPEIDRKRIEFLIEFYKNPSRTSYSRNLLAIEASAAAKKSSTASNFPRTFRLELRPLPTDPVWNNEVMWFAEVYGTNGVTTEGLTLVTDTDDATRATLQVSEEIVGDVVAYAQYPAVLGSTVFSQPLRVASFEPSSPAVELRVLPQGLSLPVGTKVPVEVFIRHQDGLWLQRYVEASEIGVTSQSPSIVSVNNPLHWDCLSSGRARVSVAWRGLTNEAEVTVFGFREDAAPIPEPLVWLSADAGLSLTNGTNVVSWTDQSRNNFVFTAPTVATQPTWVANSTSGVPAIRFNSASTPRLHGNLGRTLTNATIFTLARYLNNANGNRYIYAFGTINFSGLMMTLAREGGDDIFHYDGAAQRNGQNAVPGTGFRVFSQVFGEDGPDRHRLAVDGRTVIESRTTVGRAYSAVATNVVLGKYVFATYGFTGDLVEWLVYDRVLSVEERFEVEEYLRQRAGLSPFVAPGSLDLSDSEVVQYDSSSDPNVAWTLDLANREVRQTGAGDPAMTLSDFEVSDQIIRTRLSASAGSGAVGVVFGYQGRGQFHLFDWRQTAGSRFDWGTAPAGMRLRSFHLPEGQEPTGADFWSGLDPNRVTTWQTSTLPWVADREYDVVLRLGAEQTVMEVKFGITTLAAWTVPELKGITGRFGHYADALPGTRFGPVQLLGADPVITAIEPGADGTWTLRWMNGLPPFVIESIADLSTGYWYPVTPATPNYSGTIPNTENAAMFRVRSAGVVTEGDGGGGGGRSQTFGNDGRLWLIRGTGPTRLEAENFDEGGEGVAYHETTSQNNGGVYREEAVDITVTGDFGGGHTVGWIVAGEWLEYTVEVEAAGAYRLRARTARGSSGNRTARFLFNGVDKTGNLVIPATGNWDSYATVESGTFELAAGTQILRADMTSSDFNLNWIEIVPVVPVAQTTFGNNGNPWSIGSTTVTRIEAENFDQGGPAVAYHDTDSANQGGAYRSEDVDIQPTTDIGGGFNVGWIESGEWLEYTIDVAAAGAYQLRFRTARAPAGSSTLRVLVAGVDKTGSVTIPRTVGSQTWTTVTKTGVSLEAGIQKLRIEMVGNAFNLNWIEIAP